MTPLERALKYAARGWHIFPCHSLVRGSCSCGRGASCPSPAKHPRTRNGHKEASVDLDVITGWWEAWPDANVALATGRQSNVFVVDIDPRNGGFDSFDAYESNRGNALPTTLISLTGGGGRHLFYSYPADGLNGRPKWLLGVDVKADGGYVILPDSNHISGGRYTWLDEAAPIVGAPLDLLQNIRESGAADSAKPPLPPSRNILEGIGEGERDETLFRWACKLRRQHSTDDDGGRAIVERLVLDAARNCTPEFPRSEALRKVEQAYAQDHSDDTTTWNFETEQGETVRRLTDLGNAQRLIDANIDMVRYVPAWGWLRWTSIGWERVSDETIDSYARKVPDIIRAESEQFADDPQRRRNFLKWANDTESSGHLTAVGRLAKSDERILDKVDNYDTDDFTLACRNGIVDLRTGELRPYTRDDRVTKNTNVVYDPRFSSDLWDDFLKVSTQGDTEMMTYLQLAAGYTLTGSNAAECFFIVSGPPASGKSTFLDGLHAAMGTYATATQSDTFMYKRGQSAAKDELARLAGKRLVSVSEIRQGESFNEAIIKQLTGGDKVTARFLYHDGFEFTPQMKLWFATNHDPDTRDNAMWRRIKKISFDHAVPYERRDTRVKVTIRDPEIGGRAVLAWAVRGAVEWYQQGGLLKQPASVTNATASYRNEQDRFGAFIDETTEAVPDEHVSLNDMYSLYGLWSKNNNEFPLKRPQFTQELRTRGYSIVRIESIRSHVVVGIRARPMHMAQTGMGWG